MLCVKYISIKLEKSDWDDGDFVDDKNNDDVKTYNKRNLKRYFTLKKKIMLRNRNIQRKRIF